MADCSCAPAQSHACSGASSSPVPSTPAPHTSATLRNQCERIDAVLGAVRELLRVLSDCGASNADTTADMRVESVAVLLRDLGEQLAKAEPLIDGMAAIGRDEAPGSDLSDAIEAQGRIVFSVRHTFCALYDVIGHRCRDHHAFDVEAFTGTVHRLADCLQGVEATLFELAFGRKPMTSRPSVAPGTAAPAAAVPGATVKAPTRRTAVRPLRRPGRLARAAWRIQPLQAGAAA